MRKLLFLLLVLFITTPSYADSEITLSGQTATSHLILDDGGKLRPRPYLDFIGDDVTCVDNNGKTECTFIGREWTKIGDDISYTDGNVSIGTTEADYKLTVSGAIKASGVLFDTSSPFTPIEEGMLVWNDTDGTLDLGQGLVTLQVGQEMNKKVRNATGSTLLEGQVVYENGQIGNRPTIALARSDSAATSKITGVLTEDIDNNVDGKVTTIGLVRQIKTDYTGAGDWGTTWNQGDLLYVSKTVAGQLTNVEPSTPHHSDKVGKVSIVGAVGIGAIDVNIERHTDLINLADVNGTPFDTDGQFLTWDNSNEYFDATTDITAFNGKFGVGDTTPDAIMEISGSLTTGDIFMISSDDSLDGDYLTVMSNGNVGIGTSVPSYKLDLHGTAVFNDSDDIIDPDTLIQLSLDGTDGATSTIDDVGKYTMSFVGTAQLDTAQQKFGTASLLLDGNSDYITAPDDDDWTFAGNDFTIDFWVRFNSTASFVSLVDHPSGANDFMQIWWLNSTNSLYFDTLTGGSFDPLDLRYYVPFSPIVGVWYHIAIVRNGSTWNTYIDGVAGSKTLVGGAYATATVPNFSGLLYLGAQNHGGLSGYHNGWIDEFRITNNAKYTSNFTPPDAPYADASEDQIIVVDSNGNLGVGEISPDASIEIINKDVPLLMASSNETGDGDLFIIDSTGNVGLGDATPNATLEVVQTGSDPVLMVSDGVSGDGDLLIVQSDGNVGVGTSDATANVTIRPDANNGILITESDEPTNSAVFLYGSTGAGYMRFYGDGLQTTLIHGNTSKSSYFDAGNIGIADQTPDAQFEISASDTTPFMVSSDDDEDGDYLIVMSNGNVGIGTDAPAALLDIKGAAANGTYLAQIKNTTDSGEFLNMVAADGNSSIQFAQGGNGFGAVYINDTEGSRDFSFIATGASYIDTNANFGFADTTPDAILEVSSSAGSVTPFMVSSDDANDGDYLIIASDGNIGIGTDQPDQLLHVYDGDSAAEIQLEANGYSALHLSGNLGAADAYFISNSALGLQIYTEDGNPIRINASGATDQLFLQPTSGNIGIGTDAPATPLHVYQSSGSTELRVSTGDDSGYVEMSIDTNGFGRLVSNDSGLAFLTNNTEKMRIEGNGNVGIGTTTPTEKLDVEGRVVEQGTFGNIHVHDASAGAQSIPTGTTSTKFTGWTDNGMSANVTTDVANDKITLTKTGYYSAYNNSSFSSGTANVEWQGAFFLNGVEQDQCHWERKTSTANDIGSAGFTCLIDVTTAPWDLDFRIQHDNGGSVNFTMEYGGMTVSYEGET